MMPACTATLRPAAVASTSSASRTASSVVRTAVAPRAAPALGACAPFPLDQQAASDSDSDRRSEALAAIAVCNPSSVRSR